MTQRALDIADYETGKRALIWTTALERWYVQCFSQEEKCHGEVVDGPLGNRSIAITAAEKHFRWHRLGSPVCSKCGAPLYQRGQKRCAAGKCGAS